MLHKLRSLLARWIRLIIGTELEDQVLVLQNRIGVLEAQMLMLPPAPEMIDEVEEVDFYKYGELGNMYKITKNHELVTRREF